MRSVIVDTSCLIVLNNIDYLFILEKLYTTTLVTPTIKAEYVDTLPSFVEVRAVKNRSYEDLLQTMIDPGEASAIALSLEADNPLVILDDRKARNVAVGAGIAHTGTLGVMLQAKQRGVIPAVAPLVGRLSEAGFRISDELQARFLMLAGED